ncbi:pyridoxamine 5'-phosphate oxidase family protein [Aeromicrobium sp. CF3.5]|uniref:pyridoxamine 5'-phosphate oxidase family protein n=1 Tax=Aeromicrobium sp. CF3.5 TaxID=3373078 RepID=UPI003EE81E63
MTSQQVDDDVVVWFIAARDSRKVEQIEANPHASVTMTGDGSWVSLSGRAAVVDDLDTLRDLWSPRAEAWLPGGPEDPNAILVRVDVEGAEYWSSPDSRVATAISFVKAKLTGETADVGRHAVVEDV